MKKIIAIILIIVFIITGCSNNEKEEVVIFKMLYNTSTEKLHENSNRIFIYFTEDEKCIKHVRYFDEVEEKYTINDVERLKDYIYSIKMQNDKYNENNNGEDDQLFLWNIYFETEDNKYFYAGFDEYPDYWDELWQVLLDVSEAESLEDFGF